MYGFKDWNGRYGLARGVVRPLLHAAELIVPLLPSSAGPSAAACTTVPLHARGGGCATVFAPSVAGGPSWLRIRCPPPQDLLSVAEEILGGPLDFEALLDNCNPRALLQPPARAGGVTEKGHPEPHVAESGNAASPEVNARTLPFPGMLAQAEARRGGWYD